MEMSNELREILSNLLTEARSQNKTVIPIDLVLGIMERYFTYTKPEDLVMVTFIKQYYSDKEKSGCLIDGLISYQDQCGREGDSVVSKELSDLISAAEEESSNHPAPYPLPMCTSYHIILAALKLDKKVEDLFKETGNVGYKELSDMNTNEIFKEAFNKLGELMKEVFNGLEAGENNKEDEEFENPFKETSGFPTPEKSKKTQMLDRYAKNLLEENLDPVFGREQELSQLLEILSCKKKNNAILIGEAGVGKTAVVELLAQRIKSGQVPREFENKKIYSLDLNSLVAGTKYRGQYEERLQGIIDEVVGNPDILIYIDEIHNLVGNGGSEGSGDGANILKPYLARGKFQVLGSTTLKEFRKHIEPDAALRRRFQTVMIEEPSIDQTVTILKNIKDVYEKHHNVVYPKDVLTACVELSERYLSSSRFPDKAIDALDLSGSLCRMELSQGEMETWQTMKKELSEIRELKSAAVLSENFDEAKSQLEKEQILVEKMEKKEKPVQVDLGHVYRSIAKRSGVPIDTISSSDLEKLRKLKTILNNEVIGQEKAVREIVMSLQKNSLDIRDQSKPVSLLFTGPTGCGKTYLCKKLAEEFFGSQDALIRFDMGEFAEKHSVSKLTGATAGYIGYDDEPLFEKVRRKPYSVVLFDEIEKADPEIYQTFLNILDEGYSVLANGVKVDFRHAIIIFTGNIGTKELNLYGNGMGFGATRKGEVMDEGRKDSIIKKAIEKTFAPEFINRLSKIVMFSNLGKPELMKIVDLELKKLSGRLKKSQIKIKVGKALKEHIISQCNLNFGARDLQRKISEVVEETLCEKLLESDGGKHIFSFNWEDDKLVVEEK